MRLAWLTPLSRGSGISKYSLNVVSELRHHADVDLWAPAANDDYGVPWAESRVLRDDTRTANALAGYDHVLFNLGNNPNYHTEIYRLLTRVPGVVVVHDKRMHDFFFHLWAVADNDPARYVALMRYYYGGEGERQAIQILKSPGEINAGTGFPLVEPILWNATAVIVHSEEAARLVARYGDSTPIANLGLPFDASLFSESPSIPSSVPRRFADSPKPLIVSSGGVFEQKRLEVLLATIASERRLRDAVRCVIVGGGPEDYVSRLRNIVVEFELEDVVHITGRVDDAEMYGWLAAADIAVNLRYPSMESASLSLVEQLAFGLPVIVSETSYYSELPDSICIKIPVDDTEAARLREALLSLVTDSDRRTTMGLAAQKFAQTEHNPAVYARQLIEFIGEMHPATDR
ncbi:MAG: glycosyltransferase family 4 protein [Coriobacteriia bacterium]